MTDVYDLQVDAGPIFDDDQALHVRVRLSDADGVEFLLRVDLRVVSLLDAQVAFSSTNFRNMVIVKGYDPRRIADILVTRHVVDSRITFCVLPDLGNEFAIPANLGHG